MHKSLSISLLALLLSACATPYQARSKTMGYYETQTGPEQYRIYFNADRHTDWAKIDAHLEQRARELSQQAGRSAHTVLKREQEVISDYVTQNVGNHAYATPQSTPSPGRPNAIGHVNGTMDIYQLPFSYRQGRLDIQLAP